jgi:hypothetical protein
LVVNDVGRRVGRVSESITFDRWEIESLSFSTVASEPDGRGSSATRRCGAWRLAALRLSLGPRAAPGAVTLWKGSFRGSSLDTEASVYVL